MPALRWVALAAVAAAVMVPAERACAQDEEEVPLPEDTRAEDALPAGRIGASVGVRQGVGALGNQYGLGLVGSLEAGYHPTRLSQRVSLGGLWALRRSWFGEDEASVAGALHLIEIDFGARVRIAQSLGLRRFLVVGGGVSLMRANVPLPPDNARNYVGPFASLGFEFFYRNILIGIDGRYGLFASGPSGFSWTIGVSVGQ